MPSVKVKDGESFDSAIRRFKRAVEKAGIPKELRRREYHQKGSAIRKRKLATAKKRLLKKLSRDRFATIGSNNSRPSRGRG